MTTLKRVFINRSCLKLMSQNDGQCCSSREAPSKIAILFCVFSTILREPLINCLIFAISEQGDANLVKFKKYQPCLLSSSIFPRCNPAENRSYASRRYVDIHPQFNSIHRSQGSTVGKLRILAKVLPAGTAAQTFSSASLLTQVWRMVVRFCKHIEIKVSVK